MKVAHLRDGRLIAQSKYTETMGEGTNNIVIRCPDLKYIEYVLQVEFYTDPDGKFESHAYMDKKITGNIVGMTLYGLKLGVTKVTQLTTEIICVGPP